MKFTAYNLFMADLSKKGLDYAAEHCSSLGFDSVELLDFCGTAPSTLKERFSAAEMRNTLEKYDFKVACFSSYANILCEDREYFDREIRRQIDYAAAIGSPHFHHTVIPGLKMYEGMPSYDDVFEEVAERTESIAKYCQERGINCLYEPQGLYFNGKEGLGRLLNRLSETCPNVGMCADLGNSIDVDCDPVGVMETLGNLAKHVHIKDYLVSDESLGLRGEIRSPAGKYLNEVLPGKGVLRLGECLRILKTKGYDGPIALEYLGDDETMKNSMEYVRKLWEEYNYEQN